MTCVHFFSTVHIMVQGLLISRARVASPGTMVINLQLATRDSLIFVPLPACRHHGVNQGLPACIALRAVRGVRIKPKTQLKL